MSAGFRRTGRAPLFKSHVEVVIDTIATPDGGVLEREVVLHPGAVTVAALDGDDVYLVRQYRAAADSELLELPAGKLDHGEEPEVCARRELVEEIGMEPGTLEHLCTYLVSPGWSDEVMTTYVAGDLRASSRNPQGVEEEYMEIVRMPLADAITAIGTGEVRDAKSIIGLLLARDHLASLT